MLKIGFIGAGKMAQALAKGFIAAGLTKAENLIASAAPNDQPSIDAFKSLGAEACFENRPVVEKSDIVLVAVKPHIVPIALTDVKNAFKSNHLVMSVAMGVTLKELESLLPDGTRVIRVMPNTPCLVRCGASVYVPGRYATKEDSNLTRSLLQAVGTCEEGTEHFLDPVTALSGSGPAYVYMVIEAMADGGVKMGLPRDMAYRLAAQTVIGAGKMVMDTCQHPGKLKDDVTSPAGSTITALHYLEQSGLRAALIGAVEAATKRCREQAASNK
ncbi:UNVERIFIED_CONTAM: hypothetical protein PYX00_003111 [Menopon gallinae]|uniref:Pyrroline-5-carboxylate reductase n=1 Tax=Menopon gallinae TaxID=328185 RepID=A0AAW2I055_9NEOP